MRSKSLIIRVIEIKLDMSSHCKKAIYLKYERNFLIPPRTYYMIKIERCFYHNNSNY